MDEGVTELRRSLTECRWKSVQLISESILRKNPRDFDAVFAKSLQLYSRSKFVELEEWMKTLPKDVASNILLLRIRCKALEKQRNFSEIVDLLGGNVENPLAPPLIPLTQVLHSSVMVELREMAMFNLAQTDQRRAPRDLPPATDPLSPDAVKSDVVKALMNDDHQILQKYTVCCDRTSENDAVVLTACGCHRFLCGRVETGIAFLAKATIEDPDLEMAWIALVYILIESGEFEQGLVTLKKAQRRFPRSDEIRVLAVSLHLKTGMIELARPYLRELDANDPFTIHEMGVAYLMDGEVAQGAEFFKRVLDMDVNQQMEGAASLNLGHCFRLLYRFEDAIKLYENAVKCNVATADALASLGFTYHMMGMLDEAISNYNNSLAVNRSHPFATKMLDIALTSAQHCNVNL